MVPGARVAVAIAEAIAVGTGVSGASGAVTQLVVRADRRAAVAMTIRAIVFGCFST
jgi:hypothetical protein